MTGVRVAAKEFKPMRVGGAEEQGGQSRRAQKSAESDRQQEPVKSQDWGCEESSWKRSESGWESSDEGGEGRLLCRCGGEVQAREAFQTRIR